MVGTRGVFGTDAATGLVLALSDASSPARARPPLSTDGPTHGAAVRKYFVGAGLPESQIDDVRDFATMQGGGQEGSGEAAQRASLEYFSSVVSRRTATGVKIPDSYAWARINADNDVVMESAYWPAIPNAVIAEAEALQAVIGTAASRAAFVSHLPHDERGAYLEGTVVLHHSAGTWSRSFTCLVSYDVAVGTRTVHYSRDAVEIRLPEEEKDAFPVPLTKGR